VTLASDAVRRLGRAQRISLQAMLLGASQDAHELHMAVDLVMEAEPKVILEIGCDRGGTLYAWRQVCDRVYGITLAANADSGGAPCQEHGATVFYGDSHGDEVLAALLTALDGDPVDVLVIDGDHHLDGILADLEDYGTLVRPGGLILLHDVLPECFPEVHVHKVWPQLREKYQTEMIGNTFGWGIIRVRPGDEFGDIRL
jgi:cephalosporin hydroxylase